MVVDDKSLQVLTNSRVVQKYRQRGEKSRWGPCGRPFKTTRCGPERYLRSDIVGKRAGRQSGRRGKC